MLRYIGDDGLHGCIVRRSQYRGCILQVHQNDVSRSCLELSNALNNPALAALGRGDRPRPRHLCQAATRPDRAYRQEHRVRTGQCCPIVSPTRPVLMTSMLMFDLSLESSRRITSGYVAADVSTQRPTVDDEPIATIFTRSPDFRRAAVRGNAAPSERLRIGSKTPLGGGDMPPQASGSIQPVAPANITVPKNANPAIRDLTVEAFAVEAFAVEVLDAKNLEVKVLGIGCEPGPIHWVRAPLAISY